MQLTGLFISLALLIAPAFSAPASTGDQSATDGEKSGKYIVQLKAGVDRSSRVSAWNLGSEVTNEWKIINAFAGNFTKDTLAALRADPDVESISKDGIVTISAIQTDAPWGLARISQNGPTGGFAFQTNFQYPYNETAADAGVDIYVVDTGIRITHQDFVGRARWGATFSGLTDSDGNGHGTHCAGTATGIRWGVAKAANLIAVKVLPDSGTGPTTNIIDGLDWVATQAASGGRPSIASLSLSSLNNLALDNAVIALINQGVHVVVASGNGATNAQNTSPAHVPSVLTVGATTISDTLAWFSNYGSAVDILAPGQDVISAGHLSDVAAVSLSGTSMATPHVSGLVANLISESGIASPASLTAVLKQRAVVGAVGGVPVGTANLLARNSID